MSPRPHWTTRLKAFARPPREHERCELCAAPLPERHAHLVDPAAHRMLCACTACALLFDHGNARRYRRVPADAVLLDGPVIDDADWDSLQVPIDIAFFFDSSVEQRTVGFYPGAAGVVEASIDAALWQRLRERSPVLAQLEPDVEALLVNRLDGARECYRMPIDRCYALAGLIRSHWRGFSGGIEVWQQLERHFAALRRELRREKQHA